MVLFFFFLQKFIDLCQCIVRAYILWEVLGIVGSGIVGSGIVRSGIVYS